jgi:WD40 repeat protein
MDGRIRLQAEGNEAALVLDGHLGIVNGLAFSPDGKQLATVGSDSRLRVWDTGNGQQLVILPTEIRPHGIAVYTHDGSKLITVDSSSITIWNPSMTQKLYSYGVNFTVGQTNQEAGLPTIAITPDDHYALIGVEYSLLMFDLYTNTLNRVEEYESWVLFVHIRLSPDGKNFSNKTNLCEVKSSKCFMFSEELVSSESDFTPDSSSLITADKSGQITIWDIASLSPSTIIGKSPITVLYLQSSPDGRFLATVGGRESGSRDTLNIWDIHEQKILYTIKGYFFYSESFAFSPDSKLLAVRMNNAEIDLYNLGTGQLLHTLELPGYYIQKVQFHPLGWYLLATANSAWNEPEEIWIWGLGNP